MSRISSRVGVRKTESILRSGGLVAAWTASSRAVAVLEYAVSVAYVPSARTFGLVVTLSFFSSPSFLSSSSMLASSSNRCSAARMGISPRTFRTSWKVDRKSVV